MSLSRTYRVEHASITDWNYQSTIDTFDGLCLFLEAMIVKVFQRTITRGSFERNVKIVSVIVLPSIGRQ